jgi:hypothetical protein
MIEAAGLSTSLSTFASFTVVFDCETEKKPRARIEVEATAKRKN